MIRMKTISVIIPVYNVQDYISDCLDSLLNQKTSFDEIVIIDDGSTDESGAICEAYADKYSIISYYKQKNMGAAKARNKGVKLSKGDYVCFVDADDMVSPACCEVLKKTLEHNMCDVIYFSSEITGNKNSGITISHDAYKRPKELCNEVMTGVAALKKTFPNDFIMSACFECVKKSVLVSKKIEFLDGNVYEDRLYSLKLITESEKVLFIEDTLYIRRFRKDSISTTAPSVQKMCDAMYSHKREWEYLKQSNQWQFNEKFLIKYALSSVQMYFSEYTNTGNDMELDCKYAEMFEQQWKPEIRYEYLGVDEACSLLHLINVMENKWHIHMNFNSERVRKLLDEQTRDWLTSVFENVSSIIVYGVGEHTKSLIRLLDKYEISIDNISYMVTEKQQDNELMSVSELRQNLIDQTDLFIPSSKRFQGEMIDNLLVHGVPETKICRLYAPYNESDLVMIVNTLEEAIHNEMEK